MKRRDFLKSMAMAGATASVTGGVGMFPALLTPRTAHAAGRNKQVFISDIHMNVDGPFSWFVNHAADLTLFLTGLNTRDDVAELVILGDLLDDWVSPVTYTPQTFADILGAGNNAPVVTALRVICDNPDIAVTYVVGNHDMLSFESQNKKVIADAFPGMTIISDSPGLGAYTRDDVIWAEHGHRYTLFNAPDTWSRSNGHLALGYFISRLAASKSISSGQVVTSLEVLDRFVKSPATVNEYLIQGGYEEVGSVIDDAFIIAVFNAIALWSGTLPWDTFTMDNLDGYSINPSVEDIALIYDTIFSGWSSRQDMVSDWEAVWNDLGHLTSAANLLFEMPDRIKDLYPFTPRIVLFGHTHEAAFQYHSGEVDTIYANTGTWIDKKPITWVEIETNNGSSGRRDYTVSLWFYGDRSARQSGTVTVQRDHADYMIRHR
ncbi:MAG: metallophosphoesterase [Deltaproteobacteria bacterium]|nr:metallophosphoesterase [Deltaproteobacteria bacterium]